ncbi:MAG: hypothetical protein ACI92G_003489 [Candidatus Pelagisphaera sp.]|jgi:hypothetical protein
MLAEATSPFQAAGQRPALQLISSNELGLFRSLLDDGRTVLGFARIEGDQGRSG